MKTTNDGKKGGLLKGKRHTEGGMPAVVTNDGNRPIEVETDEVILTAPAMKMESKVVCEGTPKGIASEINKLGGGVNFSDDGNCTVVEKKAKGGKVGSDIPARYKAMGFTQVGKMETSTVKGKKWMVLAKKGNKYKVVHGGYEGMEDFSQHHDPERREKFWQRMGGKNSKKANDPFSPLYWHKKFGTWKEGGQLTGGLSKGKSISDIARMHKTSTAQIISQLSKGVNVEMEHTNDHNTAKKIAMDHLVEDATYYDKLEKMEKPSCGCSHTFKKGGVLETVNYKNQYELNRAVEKLIDEKGESRDYTDEEKLFLNKYTGSGGLAKKGASGKGLLYEYYTPDPIIQKMWALAQKYGYSGGPILEPSVGIGRFLQYAPKGELIDAFEINMYSARICEILYPQANVKHAPFETMFFNGNVRKKGEDIEEKYSLVIGNPPYGEFGGKYAGMGEAKAFGVTKYDQYFLLRGLHVLAPGGILSFIVPSAFLQNGKAYNEVKSRIADMAELVDAYRLPVDVFETTSIATDILIFKKL